jgi:hypothetical protein
MLLTSSFFPKAYFVCVDPVHIPADQAEPGANRQEVASSVPFKPSPSSSNSEGSSLTAQNSTP